MATILFYCLLSNYYLEISQAYVVGLWKSVKKDSFLNAEPVLNKFSRVITEPPSQGASQAMLYATGLTSQTISSPQIGICSVWFEGNPCNMHLLNLSQYVKEGVKSAGLVGYRFNTIGVSDGISMGTDGMSFSLQSRDIIADSIETTMSAQW
jgi:dihydroxy-acid dehydratase